MVLGLFGKSRFLDADLEEWCLESWAWLMENLGGMDRLARTPLVVPTREFFPPTETVGHERAIYIFDIVRRLMGIADWPCSLEAFDRPEPLPPSIAGGLIRSAGRPNGTFRVENGQPIIAYATDLLDQPRHLIATLAHELAHYLLATIKEPLPGGDEVHELTTELAVAYAGFAVFGANHAFSFAQHGDAFSQGWRSQRNGYFSERTWAFSLAMFARLKSVDIPFDRLKDTVADLARPADRYLRRNPHLLEPLVRIA